MKISEKIKSLRKKAGMTQEQLADRLGVSGQSVSKWENEISMPDISLLPFIAECFGVSIDELFDLTVEERLNRIENRMDIEERLSDRLFDEYREFLEDQLTSFSDRERVLSLLAGLYHMRMESDSKMVSKYAREAIMMNPAKKGCQWLLGKAEGHAVWDWNFANHLSAIEFYKKVIEEDKESPKTTLPYYYLIDNLLADGRVDEAAEYLEVFRTLPSHKPAMYKVYKAHIALGSYDPTLADSIIEDAEREFGEDPVFLFEAAQYYAKRCDYDRAIDYYERSWRVEKAPRYTDALQAIAMINRIKGNITGAINAWDRILVCLKDEWGYSEDDAPYTEAENERSALSSIL